VALVVLVVCCALAGWDLFPESQADEDVAGMQEQVEYLLAHPMNLNAVTPDDLSAVPWLNPILAERIVGFRDSVGQFRGVSQLRQVPGITPSLYQALAPVFRVDKPAVRAWTGDLVARSFGVVPAGSFEQASWFGRATIRRGPWTGVALLEKDRGETGPADWTAYGLQHWDGRLGVVLGDFTAGSGLGLVLSGPSRGSAEHTGRSATGPLGLRVLQTAAETRAMRGLGLEYFRDGWRGIVFGSRRLLDARLNADGTVGRLRLDGVHGDSAARAEQDLVIELGGGLLAGRRFGRLVLTSQAAAVEFDRDFAPGDSAGSLVGRRVASGSIAADIAAGAYRLGLEGGVSSAGGFAIAGELDGSWSGLSAGLAMTAYSRDFLAPYGRWRTLTGRRDRLNARLRMGYGFAGFDVAVAGRTYRDFTEDSLPADLELELAQKIGQLRVDVDLGWQFRQVNQRQRRSRLELDYRPRGRGGFIFRVEDRYPEDAAGRGILVGMTGRLESGWLRLAGSAAGTCVSGTGVRMYWPEPGVMRIGQSYSTARSAWRFCCSPVVGIGRAAHLGFKVGATLQDTLSVDFAGQFQLSVN
jgi:hypothetical protein